jgi:hypothetical protein
MRRTVTAEGAPQPAGPYSHAVVANGFVFISGQGPVDPETGTMPDAFADQVRQTLTNVRTILEGERLRDGPHPVFGVQRSVWRVFSTRPPGPYHRGRFSTRVPGRGRLRGRARRSWVANHTAPK